MLAARCLARFGFTMPPHNTSRSDYPANAEYLGWLGALDVSKNGYTGTERQLLSDIEAARAGIRGYSIPLEQDDVQTGGVSTFKGKPVPKYGCDGESQRQLNGQAPGPDGKVPAMPHI
ncbi:hypothetical protein OG589_23735 [Sphaerisporangium sp. NBC_01403]|uniref:hypothetical protein n=1 Tax=Sphaerisporangium sp. NBC_01403 TaxID=2903599 RepID=UPI003255DBED